MVYRVNDSNCNNWCIELMILIVTKLTQLVNYALVIHNTENRKTPYRFKDQILHKNFSHVETFNLSDKKS